MPAISVIVPVYRVEKYIRRCLNSILRQTFSDFEMILVDDGSPDSSGIICDEYASQDTRIHVIHKKNGGLSSARNAGIEAASGKYLFFVDSDDVIHPDALRILYECITKTGAEISIGEFARFSNPDSITFWPWNNNYIVMTNLEVLNSFFDSNESKSRDSLVSVCCKLIHRKLFKDIQFPVGRLYEDEFTTYKLYYFSSKTVFCDVILYYYFINTDGITQNLTLDKRFDEYDAQWERMEFFKKYGLNGLLRKAARAFLKTAQWDLIVCRDDSNTVNLEKKKRLKRQYSAAFQIARKYHGLKFIQDYDYYVLAMPEMTIFWRIRRQIQLLIKKVLFL